MPVKAYGTTISAGAEVIAEVRSIKPPKLTAKEIDTTVLMSPNEFDEFLPGLANGGECEMVLRYNSDQTDTLYALFRVEEDYTITYPNGGGWTFTGWIQDFGDDEVVNGNIITTTVKVKVTGAPEPVAGS